MKNVVRLFIVMAFVLPFTMSAQKPKVFKIKQLVKQFDRSNDTVYIVNFWATWCKPCVAELPEFDKFNKEFSAGKMKMILVTLDFEEDLEKKVIPFMQRTNYSPEVMLLDEVDGNVFINQISKEWTGAIPATLIIKNKHRKFFEKKMTYDELLAEYNAIK